MAPTDIINDVSATDGSASAEGTDWFSEDTATFGDRLAGAREAAGLSQSSLAGRLGVKTSVLRRWEDDLSEPRANRLTILAGMLGVSLSWLMTGRGDGPDAPTDEPVMTNDVKVMLNELRVLRTQMAAAAGQMATLEKRLRKVLSNPE